MFHIAYNKQTKYIMYCRIDSNSMHSLPEPDFYLKQFCANNKLNAENYVAIELPLQSIDSIVIGRDMFDETDNTIYADPDWVAPTPSVETTPTQGTT